jgi:hypothetical protein
MIRNARLAKSIQYTRIGIAWTGTGSQRLWNL